MAALPVLWACTRRSASLAWELVEYGALLTRSTERAGAYSDMVGDLTLGWIGSVVAAVVVVVAAARRDRPGRDVAARA